MLVIGTALALFLAQSYALGNSQEAIRSPYFDLVVNPHKYDGKRVSMKGFVLFDKNNRNSVFLSYDKTSMDIFRSSEIFILMHDEPERRKGTFEGLSGSYISFSAVYRHGCSKETYESKVDIISHTGIPGCLDEVLDVQLISIK